MNFLAMLPVGFLTIRNMPAPRFRLTLALWVTVSTSVELLQAVIVSRYPSLSDVMLNLSGVGVGAWLFVRRPTR